MIMLDSQVGFLTAIILAILVLSTLAVVLPGRKTNNEATKSFLAGLAVRIKAWWLMVIVLGVTVLLGPVVTVVLYGLISFLALREFVTLTPTCRGDHSALFWCFFVILPLQYVFVGMEWYGLFVVLIPVYANLFIPARIALAGDSGRFLGRTATIQWGLLVTVFFISHVPALLMLPIPGFTGQNIKLLLFIILITQTADVVQQIFDRWPRKNLLAPRLLPGRSVKGTILGGLTAIGLGTALYAITPFQPWQAAAMALAIVLAGLAGNLCMSAVKKDRGVERFVGTGYGSGGIMDRMDSVCFAAPVFFHITRYFFT